MPNVFFFIYNFLVVILAQTVLKSQGGVCEYDYVRWDTCEIRFCVCCCPFLFIYIYVKRLLIFVLYNFFSWGTLWIFSFLGSFSKFSILTKNRSSVKYRKNKWFSFLLCVTVFVFFLLLGLQTWDAGVNLGSERKGIFLVLLLFPSVSGIAF